MRRTLFGCCDDCVYDILNGHCNIRNKNGRSCQECELHIKPVSMGSYDPKPSPKEVSPFVTCRCLQDATKKEMRTRQCKYKLPRG